MARRGNRRTKNRKAKARGPENKTSTATASQTGATASVTDSAAAATASGPESSPVDIPPASTFTHIEPALILAAISGACGLAYEVLLTRLFSNYFGDGYVITGTVLATLFFGMAAGAWQAHRFGRFLWLIEGAIGLFAFGLATLFAVQGFEIVLLAGGAGWQMAMLLAVLLIGPTFLIGTCVPLFSRLIAGRRPGRDGFGPAYVLYNLGAVTAVVAVEFFLFRALGLTVTLCLMGVLNLLVAGALLLLPRRRVADGAQDEMRDEALAAPKPVVGALRPRLLLMLLLLSIGSGAYQLFALKLSFSIYGPLQENFALLLIAAILGVAAGAALALRYRPRPETVAVIGLFLLLVGMMFVKPLYWGWAYLAGAGLGDAGFLLSKSLLLAGFPFPVFVALGMTVPAVVAVWGGPADRRPGTVLALSSVGNGLGAMGMFLFANNFLTLQVMVIVVMALFALGWLVMLDRLPRPGPVLGAVLLLAALGGAGHQLWPVKELAIGYKAALNLNRLQHDVKHFQRAEFYRKYDQEAGLVYMTEGRKLLMINGYQSLTFGGPARADFNESLVGMTPAVFAAERRNALVLGLGTGISAGATSTVFDHVDVYEINPAMLNLLPHFRSMNAGLPDRANVDIRVQDGILALLTDDRRYDAIVNTVTSPHFYSSGKLYSQDFFRLASRRLTPGGVYSGWFDLNLDQQGMAVMLNTLEGVFAHCRYFAMAQGYFNAVCSNDRLLYSRTDARQGAGAFNHIEQVMTRHKLAGPFSDLLQDLEVTFPDNMFNRDAAGRNTLDRPLIEFIVTRPEDGKQTNLALGSMFQELSQARYLQQFQARPFSLYCQNLQMILRRPLQACKRG